MLLFLTAQPTKTQGNKGAAPHKPGICHGERRIAETFYQSFFFSFSSPLPHPCLFGVLVTCRGGLTVPGEENAVQEKEKKRKERKIALS